MVQQVFVIHGGSTFDSYERYLTALREIRVSLEDIRRSSWKKHLEAELGPDYDVLTPHFPNTMNAKYLEWKIWFDKYVPLLDDKVIFVGHSLGGIFLAKYLSEETYPKSIRGTFLIAAPFASTEGHSLADFTLPESLDDLARQGGEIYLYHSKDDHVVPFADLAKYQEKLPDAHARVFNDRKHFNDPEFPEIVEDIRSLAR